MVFDHDDLGDHMHSVRLSEYFINEFFLMNKNCSLADFKLELLNTIQSTKIQNPFNYEFRNPDLLIEALTHKSFSHEVDLNLPFNERLEFLGDAVLDLVMTKKVFSLFPKSREGDLSKLRSTLVNEETLSHISLVNSLDKLILLGKGEIKNMGFNKSSVLSDCFEAIIGAIYEDSNFDTVERVLIEVFDRYEKKAGVNLYSMDTLLLADPKSKLQELTMRKFKEVPKYESEEVKVDREKHFKVSVKIKEQTLATETNISKKKAMQNLAAKILKEKIYEKVKAEGSLLC